MKYHVTFIRLLLVLFLPANIAWAQIEFGVGFSIYTETYQELENALNLTESIPGWQNDSIEFTLDLPVLLNDGTGDGIMHVSINTQVGLITIVNSSSGHFSGMMMLPFEGWFADPSVDPINTDFGDIYYKYENQTSYFEFRNVSSQIESILGPLDHLESRFNFQIEIPHHGETVRYRYGPSDISNTLADALENMISIPCALFIMHADPGYETMTVTLVTEEPAAPEIIQLNNISGINPDSITFLKGFPDAGTVYEFSISTIIINSISLVEQLSFKVYPNPANDFLYLELNNPFENVDIQASIYDLAGRELIQSAINRSKALDVSLLPAGVYIIKVEADGQTAFGKWVKE